MYTVPIKLLKHFGVSSFSQYNSTKKICDYNIGLPRIIINMFIRITFFDNEYWKHWNKVEILLSVVESRNVLYLSYIIITYLLGRIILTKWRHSKMFQQFYGYRVHWNNYVPIERNWDIVLHHGRYTDILIIIYATYLTAQYVSSNVQLISIW
jgi:hypothetical protein